mmetsp:Transcript_78987/g.211019  ORF Transcript_78987/g.211019 Transcript_78987/m.211019 type:complete len:229 (-) Transcript_78987:383-1069(-)
MTLRSGRATCVVVSGLLQRSSVARAMRTSLDSNPPQLRRPPTVKRLLRQHSWARFPQQLQMAARLSVVQKPPRFWRGALQQRPRSRRQAVLCSDQMQWFLQLRLPHLLLLGLPPTTVPRARPRLSYLDSLSIAPRTTMRKRRRLLGFPFQKVLPRHEACRIQSRRRQAALRILAPQWVGPFCNRTQPLSLLVLPSQPLLCSRLCWQWTVCGLRCNPSESNFKRWKIVW